MSLVDWIIVGAVVLSILLGVLRGFVREVIAVIGWIAGAVLAWRFSTVVGEMLPVQLPAKELETALGAVVIVVGCVFGAALVGWIVRKLLEAAKLSGADRALGGLFGLLRAAVIVFLLTLFGGRTALAQQTFWRESLLLPPIAAAAQSVWSQGVTSKSGSTSSL